jgi:hypothetical protein
MYNRWVKTIMLPGTSQQYMPLTIWVGSIDTGGMRTIARRQEGLSTSTTTTIVCDWGYALCTAWHCTTVDVATL